MQALFSQDLSATIAMVFVVALLMLSPFGLLLALLHYFTRGLTARREAGAEPVDIGAHAAARLRLLGPAVERAKLLRRVGLVFTAIYVPGFFVVFFGLIIGVGSYDPFGVTRSSWLTLLFITPVLAVYGAVMWAGAKCTTRATEITAQLRAGLVPALFPHLSYFEFRGLPSSLVKESGLFGDSGRHAGSKHLFQGRAGTLSYEFALVSVAGGKGLFHGIFFHCPFPASLDSWTLVEPDRTEDSLAGLGRVAQELKADGALVRLENPEFETAFRVTGGSQIETRTVLTPATMERLLRFRAQLGYEVRLSWRAGKLFAAVEGGHTYFSSHSSDAESLIGLAEIVTLLCGLADDCRRRGERRLTG